ncbi:hypothetical protein Isop_0607 [Isosphaera pallida ATCC 43644]|uniref:Uncharacterized protein n=1 Tax=Isosphaera pallida (strain ATCC 43644 / DSM 9630 / IS1B) TaxID=575540 RepID=E8R0L5_ISOPI|nr:hypothetical protein Isop_0607 [Isosphaera pallida ATCC 43644]
MTSKLKEGRTGERPGEDGVIASRFLLTARTTRLVWFDTHCIALRRVNSMVLSAPPMSSDFPASFKSRGGRLPVSGRRLHSRREGRRRVGVAPTPSQGRGGQKNEHPQTEQTTPPWVVILCQSGGQVGTSEQPAQAYLEGHGEDHPGRADSPATNRGGGGNPTDRQGGDRPNQRRAGEHREPSSRSVPQPGNQGDLSQDTMKSFYGRVSRPMMSSQTRNARSRQLGWNRMDKHPKDRHHRDRGQRGWLVCCGAGVSRLRSNRRADVGGWSSSSSERNGCSSQFLIEGRMAR